MSYIPFCFKPYPDELLYSWLMRIADQTALIFPIFAKAYLDSAPKTGKNKIRYDIWREFMPFFRHQRYFCSAKDMVLQMTTFQFESMFLTEGEQTKYINSITRPLDKLNPVSRALFSGIRICLDCYEEDKAQYGEGYLHRVHQLSGMCMCPKHHTRLRKYSGEIGGACEFRLDDYSLCEISTGAGVDSLNAYADYVNTLYEAKVNTNVDVIKQVIFSELKRNGHYAKDGYADLAQQFEHYAHKALLPFDIVEFLKKRLLAIIDVNPKDIIAFLMFLFPDPNTLLEHLKDGEPILAEFVCSFCGKSYCSTPKGERDGWGCPTCAFKIAAEERYPILAQTATDGDYEVLGTFTSTDTRLPHKHIPCGKQRDLKPREVLYDKIVCDCEKTISAEHAKSYVERNEGFKLVEFYGAMNPVTILHERCGTEFQTNYFRFIRNPTCQKCAASDGFLESKNKLIQQIADLTGDEYTLQRFNGCLVKAQIRHNECGRSHEYLPSNFTKGSRCPYCKKILRYDQLQSLLDEKSNGAYTITVLSRNTCTVQDTETKEEWKMTSQLIKQEIFRPTFSEYFPKLRKEDQTESKAAWDIAFDLLLRYMETHAEPPPKGFLFEGFDLGLWCQHQRDDYRKGKLPQARLQKLEAAHFDWDPLETEWERKFDCYKCFVAKYGTNIPNSAEFEGIAIGKWVHLQRRRYRLGKLPAPRKEKLLSVDSQFFCEKKRAYKTESGYESQDERWSRMFDRLFAYTVDGVLPNKMRILDQDLSRWCSCQRKYIKQGTLSPERKARLDAIGFH